MPKASSLPCVMCEFLSLLERQSPDFTFSVDMHTQSAPSEVLCEQEDEPYSLPETGSLCVAWLFWNFLCRLGWAQAQIHLLLCTLSAAVEGMCHQVTCWKHVC